MSTFTWLHVSDFHISGTETSEDRQLFDGLLKDIERCRAEEGLNPDVVFFTGDITFSGQKSQYDLAIMWIDKILEVCGLSGQRDKVFIVPGNHDVDRRVVDRSRNTLKWHQTLADDLLHSKGYEAIDEFLENEWDRRWAFAKFENFSKFISDFFQSTKITFDHDKYYFVRSIPKDDFDVLVIGLNSAWLSFKDHEQGQLLVGKKQLYDALEEARQVEEKCKNNVFRIALVHHPLYWLAEKDIHKIQQPLLRNFDLLLHGHLHYSIFLIQTTPDSYLHVFAAGASSRVEYRAYNLVRLSGPKYFDGTAYVRLQHNDLGVNWGPDSLTYHNVLNGKIELKNTLWKRQQYFVR